MVEPEGGAFVTQGGELKATCNAVSSLDTRTTWLKVPATAHTHKHTLEHTLPLLSRSKHEADASMPCSVQNGVQIATGHVLTLRDATFDTAGTYECVITVPEIQEMQTSGTLVVKVRGK